MAPQLRAEGVSIDGKTDFVISPSEDGFSVSHFKRGVISADKAYVGTTEADDIGEALEAGREYSLPEEA